MLSISEHSSCFWLPSLNVGQVLTGVVRLTGTTDLGYNYFSGFSNRGGHSKFITVLGISTRITASSLKPLICNSLMDLSLEATADRNTAGGRCTSAMEKLPNTHTHTTLTHASGAVDTEEALDARGTAKEKRQASG